MKIATLALCQQLPVREWRRALVMLGLAALVLLLFADPVLAQDAEQRFQQAGQSAFDTIVAAVYWVLAIAVVGSGVAAAFGQMQWMTFGRVVVGCLVAGLAVVIVDTFFVGTGG